MLTKLLLSFCFLGLFSLQAGKKGKLNIATPQEHPYAKPEGNRDSNRFSENKVNEARVYDFYQRQADFYMTQGKTSGTIPAYPGLDAGKYGHWGKHNQNGHKDTRWNNIVDDGIVGSHVNFPKSSKLAGVSKEGGILIPLGTDQKYQAVFSPRDFNFIYLSSKSSMSYNGFRWGTSRGLSLNGETILQVSKRTYSNAQYHGYYKSGNEYIFSYTLNGTKVLDSITTLQGNDLKRLIEFQGSATSQKIYLATNIEIKSRDKNSLTLKNGFTLHLSSSNKFTAEIKNAQLVVNIQNITKGSYLNCTISQEKQLASITKPASLVTKINQNKATLKNQTYKTSGINGDNNSAYVIDDIELPYKNKTQSLMFFTGIDFNQKGEAIICSLKGDLWRVTGLDRSLKSISWTKIASGLNQPFGLRIRNGIIYVLERTRITAMHDKNGDGEIDFFECINNEIKERPRSHSHKFGLEIDKQGNFYFAADDKIVKVHGSTRKLEVIAGGVRNCMGIGMTKDGSFIVGPQEGTNTPASSLFKVYKGDDYGFNSNTKNPAAPMAYVPRGIDSSTGGFLQMDDKRWGPLANSFIGLSYGYGKWYQILLDSTGKRQQAATVPMEGQFLSGVVRAAKNPVDGQLYTVGLDGWGDYSVKDGCFHRVRFTGKQMYKPVSYKTYYNGLKIDFPVKLNGESVKNIKNYFAQQWDYLHSRTYGSPEFSVSQPDKLGHDILAIKSVQLLEGGRSIFVEIPKLHPVMQMHIRMHLKASDNTEFKTDIFPTIIELGNMYDFKGAAQKVTKKLTVFNLRSKKATSSKLHTSSGEKDAHARKITITTKNLQYDIRSITAKVGESIVIHLKNDDVMPHNLVITSIGAHEKVGMASFKMLNNPKALDLHYVPDLKDVLAYTFVIPPKGSHMLYFKVPKTKGVYPYFCSFPGHWRLMTGEIIVK